MSLSGDPGADPLSLGGLESLLLKRGEGTSQKGHRINTGKNHVSIAHISTSRNGVRAMRISTEQAHLA